jgi:hypothetical protein
MWRRNHQNGAVALFSSLAEKKPVRLKYVIFIFLDQKGHPRFHWNHHRFYRSHTEHPGRYRSVKHQVYQKERKNEQTANTCYLATRETNAYTGELELFRFRRPWAWGSASCKFQPVVRQIPWRRCQPSLQSWGWWPSIPCYPQHLAPFLVQ